MKLLQTYIPIIIDSSNSASMTAEDVKTLLGIFIFLNIIWAFSWLVSLIKNKFKFKYIDRNELIVILDITMLFIWAFVILYLVGEFIASFI